MVIEMSIPMDEKWCISYGNIVRRKEGADNTVYEGKDAGCEKDYEADVQRRLNTTVAIPSKENVLSYKELENFRDRSVLEALDFMVSMVNLSGREVAGYNMSNGIYSKHSDCSGYLYHITMILKPSQ